MYEKQVKIQQHHWNNIFHEYQGFHWVNKMHEREFSPNNQKFCRLRKIIVNVACEQMHVLILSFKYAN